MNDRIHTLEDALAVSHWRTSQEVHPLLRDVVNLGLPSAAGVGGTKEPIEAAAKVLGTMTVMNHGVPHFFGPTGGSEGLLLVCAYSSPFLASSKTSPHRFVARTTFIAQLQRGLMARLQDSRLRSPSRRWVLRTRHTPPYTATYLAGSTRFPFARYILKMPPGTFIQCPVDS